METTLQSITCTRKVESNEQSYGHHPYIETHHPDATSPLRMDIPSLPSTDQVNHRDEENQAKGDH